MQDFKKFILAAVSFFLIFVFLFVFISSAAFFNGSEYNDSAKRQELSGQIDFLIVGASHGLAAFDPKIIDQNLSLCSYNMSTSSSDIEGRKVLLEQELQRNNPETVVIEIAFDTLSRSSKDENATAIPYVACKLGSFSNSMKYILSNISFFNNDFENVLGIFLRYGIKAWKALFCGQFNIIQNNKGYLPENSVDVSLSDKDIIEKYNIDTNSRIFANQNVETLIEMINVCNEKGAKVIICVVPVSDALLWKCSDMDSFYRQLKDISTSEGCTLLDFNLYKERFSIINDRESFCNASHMSSVGAEKFSILFSDIVSKLIRSDDITNLFFDTYTEAKAASIYMQRYCKANDISI